MTNSSRPGTRRTPGARDLRALPDHASTTPNPYFALRYAALAAPGLPPVVQASRLTVVYEDGRSWVSLLMDPPEGAAGTEPRLILRLPESDIAHVSEHPGLREALAAAFAVTTD